MSFIDYSTPGPLTSLASLPPSALAGLPSNPVGICAPVRSLVILPDEAQRLGLPKDRFTENQLRPASRIVEALLQQDPAPLTVARPPEKRVVGTCRHFAILSCALLRRRGIPSRVRCGFATYFQKGKGLDHWITEYWEAGTGGWVRIDSEILGGTVLDHPERLRPGEFLSGGEAWVAYRRGEIDAKTYGVWGSENWGPAEIKGNLVKDLAALNKVEMLPWDEWGRMTEAYANKTGPDYDALLDRIADTCVQDEPPELARAYAQPEFVVPESMVR